MRRMFAVVFIACLGLACRGAARAGDHPWDNKRIYYVVEIAGRLAEKGYFVRHAGSYQKNPIRQHLYILYFSGNISAFREKCIQYAFLYPRCFHPFLFFCQKELCH